MPAAVARRQEWGRPAGSTYVHVRHHGDAHAGPAPRPLPSPNLLAVEATLALRARRRPMPQATAAAAGGVRRRLLGGGRHMPSSGGQRGMRGLQAATPLK